MAMTNLSPASLLGDGQFAATVRRLRGRAARRPDDNFTFYYLIPPIVVSASLVVLVALNFYLRRRRDRQLARIPPVSTRPLAPRLTEITKTLLDAIPVAPFQSPANCAAGTATADVELGSEAPRTRLPPPENQSDQSEVSGWTVPGLPGPSNVVCPVCTENFAPGQLLRVLPCGHQFHPPCVDPWLLERSSTCPMCRSDLRSSLTPKSISATTELNNGV